MDKSTPKEVYEKFSSHKLCKHKCILEKDALKMCNDLHDPKYAMNSYYNIGSARLSNKASFYV